MPTITINSVTFLIESRDGSILTLAKMGKRGKLLAPRWLAVVDANGGANSFRKWF